MVWIPWAVRAVILLAVLVCPWGVGAQEAPKPPRCEEAVAQTVSTLQKDKLLPESPVPAVAEALQLLATQIRTSATKAEFLKQRAELDLNNVATLVTQVQSLQQTTLALQKQLDDLRSQQTKAAAGEK
jgi:hypothetical protein